MKTELDTQLGTYHEVADTNSYLKYAYKMLKFIFLCILLINMVTMAQAQTLMQTGATGQSKQDLRLEQVLKGNIDEISSSALFELLFEASKNGDTSAIVMSGYEIIKRLREGQGIEFLLQQLNRDDTDQNYKSLLYGLVQTTHRQISDTSLLQIFRKIQDGLQSVMNAEVNPLNEGHKQFITLVYNDLIGDLWSRAMISDDEVALHCELLRNIMKSDNEDPQLRRIAIKGLQSLRCTGAISEMKEIISDPIILNNTAITGPICNALAFFRDTTSLTLIHSIATKTETEQVFASAIIAIADLACKSSLGMIIEQEYKFDGRYTAAAVNQIKELVFSGLIQENNSDLTRDAVIATKYLYKLEDRDRCKLLLKELLLSATDEAIIKQILSIYLQFDQDRSSLQELIQQIPRKDKYFEEWDTIDLYIRMKQTEIFPSTIPTEGKTKDSSKGNTVRQEYGDVGYQDNIFEVGTFGISYAWLGHAAIYTGIDNSFIKRQIAMNKSGVSGVISDIPWSDITNSGSYWGAYKLNNKTLSFADRRDIVNTAVLLTGYNIGYPSFNLWPNALDHISNPGTYINVNEITNLRCDGVIEYCYEWNNHYVWGNNQTGYDISITSNVASHNECYHWTVQNPCTALSPVVQCGGHGVAAATGNCTYLTADATADYPSYSFSYVANCNAITISITATDVSGIKYIAYKIGTNPTWTYSQTQPQHPSSNAYTWQFTINLQQDEYIYFFAEDNGGNYPQTAQSSLISTQKPPTQPGPITGNTSVCSGTQYTYSISAVSGATSYTWAYSGGGTPSGTGVSCTLNPISSGTLSVVAINACGSSVPESLNIQVKTTPGNPSITVSGIYCFGASYNMCAICTGDDLTYNWQLPPGWTKIQTQNCISGTVGLSGMMNLTIANSCGSKNYSSTFSVNNAPTQPEPINGEPNPILGQPYTYTIPPTPLATSYTWTYTGSATPAGTNTSCVLTPMSSGTLCVVANNSCGAGSPRCLHVTASVTPTTYNISGFLRYSNANMSPLAGSTINLCDSNGTILESQTSGSNGAYTFTLLSNNLYRLQPQVTKPWGGVTAMDLTRYRQVIANIDTIAPMSPFHKKAGDVNLINGLTAIDLTMIRNRIAGITTSFQYGDWLYDSTEVVVQGANVNRNIYALCYGDGNGSYTPAAKSSFPELLQSSSQIMTVTDPNYITLPLIVNKGIDVASITMDIAYREDLLEFISAEVPQFNNELSFNESNGIIRMVFSSLQSLEIPQGASLVYLHFKARSAVPCNPFAPITSIEAELGNLMNEEIHGMLLEAPMLICDLTTGTASLPETSPTLNVYPNPFSNQLNIDFILHEAGYTKLELYDHSGRRVRLLLEGQGKAGNQHYVMENDGLSEGLYFLKMFFGNDQKTNQIVRKITLIR